MEEIKTEVKYPIEKDFTEKLKLFFMCVRSLPQNPLQVEKFIGVVAYRQEDAFVRARNDYGDPGLIVISHSDYVLIEDLFRGINTGEIKAPATATEMNILLRASKELSFESFKNCLLLSAVEYVKDPKDKIQLKNIIKKI